ncbi:MAG: YqaJ viral recombinase family protein [Desulfobacterales bacterium]|nr:YqaJ viral recombinase family protein [Desulfobacterales bacterium]
MEQGSEKWHAFRSVRITGSRFGDVLAKPTTKRYQNYQREIIEALEGVPTFSKGDEPWYRHGKVLEPEARRRYEWETGYEVIEKGVIVHSEFDFISISPDGLINQIRTKGGLEIKGRKSLKEHMMSVKKGIPSLHKPQVIGSLWVSEREWWDFMSYYKHPKTKQILHHIHRVYPDQEYFKRLQEACLNFWNQVQKG